jgi:hypothetical protein
MAVAGTPTPVFITQPGTPERAVEEAYLYYWAVRADAFRRTDTSRLGEVMDGAELERTRQQIDELRAKGQAARVDLQHHYWIVDVEPLSAGVEDDILNRSVLIDPVTGADLQDPGAGEHLALTYQLKRLSEVWKVIDSARVEQH